MPPSIGGREEPWEPQGPGRGFPTSWWLWGAVEDWAGDSGWLGERAGWVGGSRAWEAAAAGLWDIATWVSQRHFRGNVSQPELWHSAPFSWVLFPGWRSPGPQHPATNQEVLLLTFSFQSVTSHQAAHCAKFTFSAYLKPNAPLPPTRFLLLTQGCRKHLPLPALSASPPKPILHVASRLIR